MAEGRDHGYRGEGEDGRGQQSAFESADRAEQVRQRIEGGARDAVRTGVATFANGARRASEEITRTLGFAGDEAGELARRSAADMEAVTRCGAILAQGAQDYGRGVTLIMQEQFARGLDGMNRLAGCRNVQEFLSVQGELARDGMSRLFEEGRQLVEIRTSTLDKAGRAASRTDAA